MESPIYGPASRALGQERFEDLMMKIGELDGNVKFLLVSVSMIAGMREWTDDQLDALVQDSRDVKAAAARLSAFTIDLASKWRAQRQELEA